MTRIQTFRNVVVTGLVGIGCLSLGAASGAQAHEVWLEPLKYQVATAETIAVDIRNGEKFSGWAAPYTKDDVVRLDTTVGETTTAISGRLGDRPAVSIKAPDNGLHIISYQSSIATLTYKEWEKFLKFAAHKDFADIEARHKARNLPRENFVEKYTRFAKALVAVGNGAGQDREVGLETEIIALANPYTEARDAMSVRVLYQGKPRANAQVELFAKAPDDSVVITLHRTDENGEAQLPVKPGHRYLVDAVVLRNSNPDSNDGTSAVWETLWAALTFQIPATK